MNRTIACATALIAGLWLAPASAKDQKEWLFRVLLDGKPVGEQFFRVSQDAGTTLLETEANLHVKFLFATLFRYKHNNKETWDGDCLTGIESDTKANRKSMSVRGRREDGYFSVKGSNGAERLPECIMTFAYWNPQFLAEPQLLNPQTGEYLAVDVEGPFDDQVILGDQTVAAHRYHLSAKKMDIQLWYSLDREWLALESKTKGDRTLRYEPQ